MPNTTKMLTQMTFMKIDKKIKTITKHDINFDMIMVGPL